MAGGPHLEETEPTGDGRARGLVSDRASGNRIEAKTFAPPDVLAPYVAALWTGRWDLRGQAPHTTELLADPCPHFVYEDGGPHAGRRVVGVWTELWTRTLEDRGRVWGVKIRAGGIRAFTDVPAHELTNRIRPLEEIVAEPPDERAVFERGHEALVPWLTEHLREDADASLAIALVDAIAADSEITTVDELTKVAGVSVRPLQRLFREHVGASPKWVIRRNRLQEVALRIERGDAPNLADLAAELGYADQAHLTRDFKAATGRSPAQFRTG